MLIALLVTLVPPLFFGALWEGWIYKGLTLLLIGCPCALVISTPAAITSGLAAAARRGALIKGGAALEQLSRSAYRLRQNRHVNRRQTPCYRHLSAGYR